MAEQLLVELAVVAITILTAFYFYVQHRYSYWTRRNIKQLQPRFPKGNLDSLLPKGPAMGLQSEPYYLAFKSMGVKYGGVYGILQPMLCLTDIDIIKEILIRDFHSFSDRGIYIDKKGDPLNVHLLNQEKDDWKAMRTKLSPTFTINKLRGSSTIMAQLSDNMVTYLDGLDSLECVDIVNITRAFTIDVIGNTVFGIECNCFQDPENRFRTMALTALNPSLKIIINACISHYLPRLGKLLGLQLFEPELQQFFTDLVESNMKYRNENGVVRQDLFQSLLEMRNKNPDEFTVQDATAQTMVFFLAGFETSSNTIKNCLLELARHPKIQERARQDVLNGVAQNNGLLDYDALGHMKYLQQCVDETLRLYPVLATLTRRSIKPYTIPGTQDTLPKGTLVLIPIFAIHRDADHWPKPMEFDPERFNDISKPNIPSGTYLPFGDGPRNCIGMRFGTMQVQIGLCRLLMNYRFTVHPETVYPVEFDRDSFGVTNVTPIKLNLEKIH